MLNGDIYRTLDHKNVRKQTKIKICDIEYISAPFVQSRRIAVKHKKITHLFTLKT